MYTENSITIKGSADRVFEIASNVLSWPEILPHYRFVNLIREEGHRRVVEMAAHRDGIPVKWTSIIEPLEKEKRIHFWHIKGPSKGMFVEWIIREAGGGYVSVRITHDLNPRDPVSRFFAKYIIGKFFVHNIASKTLKIIKERVEKGGR